jgi:methylenetetrahydrofolate--tRNA-(uracil-5-)-methyltransferase
MPTLQLQMAKQTFLAGQIIGVEGYVESAASGLIAGPNAAAHARGEEPRVPPRTTAIGSLAYYVSHADPRHYQPSNITFGIMPPPSSTSLRAEPSGAKRIRKDERKTAISQRALNALDAWIAGDAPAQTGALRADHVHS